jgi:amino acid permease
VKDKVTFFETMESMIFSSLEAAKVKKSGTLSEAIPKNVNCAFLENKLPFMATTKPNEQQLKRTLGPLMLWGLGVGYVISGMYFGWNLGLEKGGTLGLAVATFFIIILYLTFTFSYTELACAIPRAGGAFDYAIRALGKNWGFLGGMAQNIEFIFAPPAIAFAIGAYLHLLIPSLSVMEIAIFSYLVFTALNISGVQAAASFELVVTIVAVVGLLIFAERLLFRLLNGRTLKKMPCQTVGRALLPLCLLRSGFSWRLKAWPM